MILTDPEVYFRQAIYVPYTDNMLAQLRERSEPHNRVCLRIQALLLRFLDLSSFDDLREVADLYRSDLGPRVIAGNSSGGN